MQSRLYGCEEGLALLFAEILDHHLIVVRQRTRPAEQLLDRELQVLGSLWFTGRVDTVLEV